MALMRVDLPTLERPRTQISGVVVLGGRLRKRGAEKRKVGGRAVQMAVAAERAEGGGGVPGMAVGEGSLEGGGR